MAICTADGEANASLVASISNSLIVARTVYRDAVGGGKAKIIPQYQGAVSLDGGIALTVIAAGSARGGAICGIG